MKTFENTRKLTPDEPEIFEPKMRRLCAEAGVALVFVSELPEYTSKWGDKMDDKRKSTDHA